MADALLKLQEQVTCSVCLEVYKQPRSLSCQHAFCTQCIDQLPVDIVEGEYKIKCPSCRKTTPLPKDGSTASLPPAFHINAIIELYEMSKATPPVLEQVAKYTRCPKHYRDMEMFCEECQQVVCAVCAVRDHNNHTCDLITAAFPKHQREIEDHLRELKQAIGNALIAKDNLDTLENGIRAQTESTKSKIDNYVQKIIEKVQEYSRELKLVDEKLKLITEQKEKVREALLQLTGCEECIEKQLHNGPQESVLQDKPQMITSIKDACQEISIEKPLPNEHLVFIPNQDVIEKCSNIGEVKNITLQPFSRASITAVAEFSGNESAKATVGIENSMDLQLSSKPKGPLACYFYNREGGYGIAGTIKEKKVERGLLNLKARQPVAYSISYVPTYPGLYQIILLDGDTNVSCDPCTIQVLKPFHEQPITTEVHAPRGIVRGIAFTKDDVMVVCEMYDSIITVVKEGHVVRRFSKDGTKTDQLYPTGVAITPDHHIIVVDGEYTIRIKKFTFDGECVEISEQIDAGQPPHDVAVDSKGRIYVPIRNGVQVLYPNLSFSHHFSEYMERDVPHSIAIDSHDNLYLCNYESLYKITCDDGMYITYTCLHCYHNRTIENERCDGMSCNHIPIILYTVAVDQHDIVYLTDHDERKVIIFMDDNIVAEVPCTNAPYQGWPCGIAVNSKGDACITYTSIKYDYISRDFC